MIHSAENRKIPSRGKKTYIGIFISKNIERDGEAVNTRQLI